MDTTYHEDKMYIGIGPVLDATGIPEKELRRIAREAFLDYLIETRGGTLTRPTPWLVSCEMETNATGCIRRIPFYGVMYNRQQMTDLFPARLQAIDGASAVTVDYCIFFGTQQDMPEGTVAAIERAKQERKR